MHWAYVMLGSVCPEVLSIRRYCLSRYGAIHPMTIRLVRISLNKERHNMLDL